MPAYHTFLKIVKNMKLPEYGYIGLTELEVSIIDTYFFQRLRRIRQSLGVSLVYPGASHTRFEHSIGAMHLAGEAAIHLILNSKGKDTHPVIEYFKTEDDRKKTSQLVQIARLGALLHDVGHGPLSHTFEYFLKFCNVTWTHENLSMEIIYKKLKQFFDNKSKNPYGVDVRHVISLLCDLKREAKKISIKADAKSFLKSIGLVDDDISFMEEFLSKNWFLNHIIKEDPYNVDRFNYLILDSNRSGAIDYGSIDFQRLI
ncbi:MAG: HD domain-containing protein, partial [Candidatus Nitrosotenuis sp.]